MGRIGIRREDSLVYERRAAMTPKHVRELIQMGHQVVVEPAAKRAFADIEFEEAGATLNSDLSKCDVILGVKQIPISSIIPNSTCVFFSHTIKAQPDNMPLLDACLEQNVRLVDYEKIEENGIRKVAFGHWAGVAGAINALNMMGKRMLSFGHNTPLTTINDAGGYLTSEEAKVSISRAGKEIRRGALAKTMDPLTFVITGRGRVAQGAEEILNSLGVEWIKPEELKNVARGDNRKMYATFVEPQDHLVHPVHPGKSFPEVGSQNWDYFLSHNSEYESNFSETVAPYMSCLINCLFWSPGDPKIMTTKDLTGLIGSEDRKSEFTGVPYLPQKLSVIADISADLNGSLEFIEKCTSVDEPFEIANPKRGNPTKNILDEGVLITSIDYLPALLPREASEHFGDCLIPFIEDLVNLSKGNSSKVSGPIRNAVICQNGALTKQFRYISDLRQENRKKVLILGAGYVSAPVVDYLSSQGHVVTLVSAIENEAKNMTSKYGYENVEPLTLDCLKEKDELSKLIGKHDLVVSLLPYIFHPEVAEIAISQNKNMVTASYLSPGMEELNQKAINAGITVVNEVGVDPGIDHMLAMELFHELEESGKTIKSFVSFCGGLPAPEASNNALGYKFSWSPRGVLLNTVSGAKWLHAHKIDEIAAGGEIINRPYRFGGTEGEVPFSTWNGFSLEGLPNRDSTNYLEPYGLKDCETILRGTFRYKGYCAVLRDLQALQLIDESPSDALSSSTTWREFISKLSGSTPDALDSHLAEMRNKSGEPVNVGILKKLGILSNRKIENKLSPLDALATLLNGQMQYEHGERDAILMRHEVVTHQEPDKVYGVDFIFYGDQGSKNGKEYSAMAQTVGYPAAIAAHLVLEGKITKPGMLTPLTKDIYKPILAELKKLKIEAKYTIN